MDYKSARSFAITLSHRAIGDLQREGFRQLRNYVDMCALLANQHKQKRFFARAQDILQKTDSLYYSLIHRLVNEIDEDRICAVGVNLGFDSLIYGAGKMKAQAQKTHEPFSWVSVGLAGDEKAAEYVAKGEEKGCFFWLLYAGQTVDAQALADLAARYPQSAFAVVAQPSAYTQAAIETLAAANNMVLMIELPSPEMNAQACEVGSKMRHEKMFFGYFVAVDDETAPMATDREWVDVIAQHTMLCLYARKPGMKHAVSEKMRKDIIKYRVELGAPVLLLDWDSDTKVINGGLSPYACIGDCLPDGTEIPLQVK